MSYRADIGLVLSTKSLWEFRKHPKIVRRRPPEQTMEILRQFNASAAGHVWDYGMLQLCVKLRWRIPGCVLQWDYLQNRALMPEVNYECDKMVVCLREHVAFFNLNSQTWGLHTHVYKLYSTQTLHDHSLMLSVTDSGSEQLWKMLTGLYRHLQGLHPWAKLK